MSKEGVGKLVKKCEVNLRYVLPKCPCALPPWDDMIIGMD